MKTKILFFSFLTLLMIMGANIADAQTSEPTQAIEDLRSYSIIHDSATISWKSSINLTCVLEYSNNASTNTVDGSMVQSGTEDNDFSFIYNNRISGLEPGENYIYTVNCTDQNGQNYSDTSTLTTLSAEEAVSISSEDVCKTSDGEYKFTWNTNKQTSYNFVMITNEDLGLGRAYEAPRGVYDSEHEITASLDESINYSYSLFSKIIDDADSAYKSTDKVDLIFNNINLCGSLSTTEDSLPDLIITDVDYKISDFSLNEDKQSIDFTVKYKNDSNTPIVDKNFYICVFTESTNEYAQGYKSCSAFRVMSSLSADVPVNIEYTFPQTLGGYLMLKTAFLDEDFIFSIDSYVYDDALGKDNIVDENNENNNTYTKRIVINAPLIGATDVPVMSISNARGYFYSDDSAYIEWIASDDYDCTVIFSTKDDNLDDDNLLPGRDADDYLYGSVSPENSIDDNYYYKLKIGNGHINKDINKGYFNVICYDYKRNKKSTPIYNFTRVDDEIVIDSNTGGVDDSATLLYEEKIDEVLARLGELQNTVREQNVKLKYLDKLSGGLKKLSKRMENAINSFITYGVDDNTKKLGEGERAAVVHSYKSAFNKLPETEEELADIIKIANGRWPSITNNKAEKRAKKQFEKIYKRIADMNNPQDNAAITVMAYGLRQRAENRNMGSEEVGIKTFRHIYGYNPSTTEDWNTMQAITYSGATRGVDSDGDLLTDEREAELGTDPHNPDSDGDGYMDGSEVANGYNPNGEGKL